MIFNDNVVENAASALAQLLQTKLDTIGYDKTMVYTIVDDSQKDKGQYKVSDGSVAFDVYSETTTYKKDEKVYITIPQGDFREKKVILGKYIEAEEALKDIGYISPNDRIVPIHTVQDSLLDSDNKTTLKLSPSTDNLEVYGQLQKIELTGENKHWAFVEKNLTRLAVKVGIKSSLSDFNIVSGEYGLRAILFAKQGKIEENSQLEATTIAGILSEAKEKGYEVQVLEFSSSNMIGNIYNYKGIIEQSYIYDISNMGNIVYYMPMVYHKKDFKSKTLTGIVDLSTISTAQNATIEFYNLDLSFGYGQEEFSKEDNLLLFTHPEEDSFYSSGVEAKKILYCHNIKLNQKTLKYEYMLPADLNKTLEDYSIISSYEWYESTTQMSDNSRLGFGWKPIDTSNQNIFEIKFTSNEPSKKYKVLKVIQEGRKLNATDDNLSQTESFIESNEIIFSNTDFSQNVSGQAYIEILDEQKDFIGLYQDNYKIINYEDFLKTRTLRVTIPSTREYDTIQINWYIPKGGSMLQDVIINGKNNSRYALYNDESTVVGTSDTDDFYYIIKTGVKSEGLDLERFFRQSFGISEYFQPAFLRNQISCKIYYDNDFSYCDEGHITLSFGLTNLNGSVYNFGLQFVDCNKPYLTIDNPESFIQVKGFLTSNSVTITDKDLEQFNSTLAITSINNTLNCKEEDDTNLFTITPKTTTGPYCGVLKATATVQNYNLTAYLQIPGRYTNDSDISIQGISGTTGIYYDSFGKNLNEVIYPLKLYGKYPDVATESKFITIYDPIPKTRSLMSQFKDSSLSVGSFNKSYRINFIPSKYIFEFKMKASLDNTITVPTLEVGSVIEVVAKADYVEITKKGDVNDSFGTYSNGLYCLVVDTNKCVFYGCNDTQKQVPLITEEGSVDLNKLLNNIPNKNYYFYTHNYYYDHFEDRQEKDRRMPFQIEFEQDENNENSTSQNNFIPYVCIQPKDGEVFESKIITSSLMKRFYKIESQVVQITKNKNVDFCLPCHSEWRKNGFDDDYYIYKIAELSNSNDVLDIWVDATIAPAVGKDVSLVSATTYTTQNNKVEESKVSPYTLAQNSGKLGNYITFYSINNLKTPLEQCKYVLDDNGKPIFSYSQGTIETPGVIVTMPDFTCYSIEQKAGESIPVDWKLSRVTQNGITDINVSNPIPGEPIIKYETSDEDDVLKTSFLQPYPIYVKESALEDVFYILSASMPQEESSLWVQPVIIQQNRYEFEVLNNWNGTITTITEDSIMSPCIGAGSKNSENQFSGVLMGKIGKSGNDTNPIHGLYGFSDGAQAFGFKEDGTAFIGKSGAGRINFDGKNGTITSLGYENGLVYENTEGKTIKLGHTGIKIDLDDPSLDMKYDGKSLIDFKPKDNTMILNSSNTYESEDADGKAISLSKFSLDLNEGTLKAIDFSLFAGDDSYIQGGSGRGLSINSKVNGKPPLFVGYDKSSNNLPFDYPSFQIGWNGNIEAKDLNLNGLKVNNSTLSFDSKLDWYNSTSFFGSLEMGRITFTDGTYKGESYILYFNMEGTSSSTTFFIDIRPNFEKTSGLNYYDYCIKQTNDAGKKTNIYEKDSVVYVIPRMQWKKETGFVKTWSETTDGKLGKDVIAFTDFTKPNCVVESQNVSSVYFRFLILDLSSDDNRLGFAANQLSASWAIVGEGTKDTKLSELWASQLVAGFANMSDYNCKFYMSGVTDLTDNFIDIQVNMTSGGTILTGPEKIKTAGFYIDAFGETYISDLKIGQRDDNNKLSYVSLEQHIIDIALDSVKQELLKNCIQQGNKVQGSDGTYTYSIEGTKESLTFAQATCLAFVTGGSGMVAEKIQ